MGATRFLVADDDPEMRAWLMAVLGHRGVEVAQVESGVELLRALAQDGPFDLVVADVRMSWATGLQALSMARAAGYLTPFVVITAHADESVRASAFELGATVLEKPFSIEELLRTADGVLARPAAAGERIVD
jgi:CheY-like chemotaxis protein